MRMATLAEHWDVWVPWFRTLARVGDPALRASLLDAAYSMTADSRGVVLRVSVEWPEDASRILPHAEALAKLQKSVMKVATVDVDVWCGVRAVPCGPHQQKPLLLEDG